MADGYSVAEFATEDRGVVAAMDFSAVHRAPGFEGCHVAACEG
jgi:hypothetical protein